jgi:hypothetical protein
LLADFGANRHAFISNLCRTGLSRKVVQPLARHWTIMLTMNVYRYADTHETDPEITPRPIAPSRPQSSVATFSIAWLATKINSIFA